MAGAISRVTLLDKLQCGGSVNCLQFSWDGVLLASGDATGAVIIWDSETGEYGSEDSPEVSRRYAISDLSWQSDVVHDVRTLYAGTSVGCVKRYKILGNETNQECSWMAIEPSVDVLTCSKAETNLDRVAVASGLIIRVFSVADAVHGTHSEIKHQAYITEDALVARSFVTSLVFSRDCSVITFSLLQHKCLIGYNLNDQARKVLHKFPHRIASIHHSEDQRTFIVTDLDEGFQMYDWTAGHKPEQGVLLRRHVFEQPYDRYYPLQSALLQRDSVVVTGSEEGVPSLWSTTTGAIVQTLLHSGAPVVAAVAASKRGPCRFATGEAVEDENDGAAPNCRIYLWKYDIDGQPSSP